MSDDATFDGPADELPTEASDADSRTAAPDSSSRPRLANYELLDRIGSGGMGDVYAAEQLRPMRRKVAVKVVKLGMDSREVLRRFESERQALALMNHPNIARVYDAGTTEEGRPFFAMEYVQGESITSYCARHRLDIRRRLELVAKACDGVQHAHQKGIIHRDLKPSNVLVAIEDDRPEPKIIDFGVAKATAQQLSEDTMHTSMGVLLGTPEYMSPEQAEMTGLDVDTRTDVYSLGVLLYEVLVGAHPFASHDLRQSGIGEIQRRIRELEPARPSARITELGDKAPEIGEQRHLDMQGLARRLRGDLDWITLKAMDKDRTRRYQTANALAVDIRRYLADEPVLATPPSALYRARKFARRHRGGVVAGALVAGALLVGAIATTASLVRAVRAERLATAEAESARQVAGFLVDLFQASDPTEDQGDTITARDVLDEGARRISGGLTDQPLTQARLMDAMGTVYRYLGLYEEARTLLERALEIRESALSVDDREVAASLVSLGWLEQVQGRYPEAQRLGERALEILEKRPDTHDEALAEALMVMGWSQSGQSRHEEAAPFFERATAILERALGPDDPKLANSLHALGISSWRRGDFDAAQTLLSRALETYEQTLGPNDYRLREVLNDLGVVYLQTDSLAAAEPLLERAIAIKERVVGPEHPSFAKSLNNLALIYDQEGHPEEAGAMFRRVLEILEESLGTLHDTTAMAMANLAWAEYRQGEYDEAEALYRKALGIYERTVGRDNTGVAILLGDQARLFADQGRFAEAEAALRQSAEIWEKTSGSDHPELASSLTALAELYVAHERPAEAAPLYERALAIRRERLGPDDAATRATAAAYAALIERLGGASATTASGPESASQ